MNKPKHTKTNDQSILSPVLLSIFSGMICLTIGITALSLVIHNGNTNENVAGYGITALWFITACVATIISYTKAKSTKLICVLISVSALIILPIMINVLFLHSQFVGVGRSLIAVLAGSALFSFLLSRKKENFRKHKKYRIH